MNMIPARIIDIATEQKLSYITSDCAGDRFACLVLETPETNDKLRVGADIALIFKEAEVVITKNVSGHLSLRNRMAGTVRALLKGTVITKATVSYRTHTVISLISTAAAVEMRLNVGDEVTAWVKATDVAIRWKG